jgi:purine-binding chemotaxis protein CheW
MKFGLPEMEYGHRTCIIVVEVGGSTSSNVGIIVDEVSEVMNLADSDIQDTPDFGRGVQMPYLLGMAKIKDRVKILLDIDEVLNAPDLRTLSSALS